MVLLRLVSLRDETGIEPIFKTRRLTKLHSALTLENLETAFYQQGFAALPQQKFLDLGLTQVQVKDLLNVGASEAAHVSIIQSTLAQMGVKPVQACTYNFGDSFASATNMVKTATILEQVGVSAYAGAAPIIAAPAVLAAAASIFSVEGRHQSFLRIVAGSAAAPDFFDTPLSPKQIFSLAAPFIVSCPAGSNLVLTANPPITMSNPLPLVANTTLALTSTASAAATACAFIAGGLPTGAVFTAFANGACTLPENLTGVTYLNLVNAVPADGKITDAIVVAGPMVLTLS